ncbi:MAG: hypothetical protein GC184_11155 [Rhizobiales bacterium]|nr:hypothetical protein [Hyphomicrobiales bacterium]
MDHRMLSRGGARRWLYASLLALAMLGTGASTALAAEGWRSGAPMMTARAFAGAALVGDDLYVIGGDSTSGPRSLTEIYDIKGDIWRASAALPVGLQQFGIAALDSRLYVAGGLQAGAQDANDAAPSNSVWMLDPRVGTWTRAPSLPTARVGLALVVAGGKIYAMGGRGADAELIYVFDPGTNQWTTDKARLSSERVDAAYIALGNDIYVIGGRIGGAATSRVDVLDTGNGNWRSAAAMPAPREGHVAALVNGVIHVTGGETLSPPKTYADHFALDVKTGSWSRLDPMPVPRHGSVAAADDNRFVVIGGSPGAGVYTVFTESDVVDIFETRAD